MTAHDPHQRRFIDRFQRMPPGGTCPAARLVLRAGSPADYHALAHLHYRAGTPATIARILTFIDPEPSSVPAPRPAAVLVISMPTLEGRWRTLAWPGRYSTGDKRADARRINTELRTISRLIVDPRWRGLGVGRRLIRAYLDAPLSPATEAVAAMGTCCPVFRAAGMTEFRLGPDRRDARLLDALHAARIPPCHLSDPAQAPAHLSHPFIARELRLWADASRTTRVLSRAPTTDIARRAAAALAAPRIAYASTTPEGPAHAA